MSTTAAKIATVDEELLQHTKERLEVIGVALDDDPESALNRIRDYAETPLYYPFRDVESLALHGAFPVFEEDTVYVPCDGLSDAEILRRAKDSLHETGWDEADIDPPLRIQWRGHVLMLADHSGDGDVMFWFRRVQPDERATLMAFVR